MRSNPTRFALTGEFVDFLYAISLHWRRFKLSVWRPAGIFPGVLLIDKGFGFIRDEGGIEHFFHRSSVRGAVFELLREGQRVEFTPEESGKGPRAGEVRLIEG
jgi:CspA family cold shock protein